MDFGSGARERHDNYCLGESQVLEDADPRNWIGDKGFIGNGMITPFRGPAGGELLDSRPFQDR